MDNNNIKIGKYQGFTMIVQIDEKEEQVKETFI
jgi:hypothetical protein